MTFERVIRYYAADPAPVRCGRRLSAGDGATSGDFDGDAARVRMVIFP